MAIIKYRESPTAEWQELPVANKVTIKMDKISIKGDCTNRFNAAWDGFLSDYEEAIITEDITKANGIFNGVTIDIPFELNFDASSENHGEELFNGYKGKTYPKINGYRPASVKYLFQNNWYAREIPEHVLNGIDWSYADTIDSGYNEPGTFYNCYSLRKLPIEILEHVSNNLAFALSVGGCHSLDEIIGFPIADPTNWNTGFSLYRIKNLTFKMPNGAPYVVNWKSKAINMANYTGYAQNASYITGYNSGITAEKQVIDDTTYAALKDDPDWWTMNVAYSRYNHDSAVATLNSLPDASAGGANTIRFKGEAGSATDGGAINTLTDAEIAVAAAKGWTVTLV